jgi:hypothetical protein
VWRAGANENTLLSLYDPVLLDSKAVPAELLLHVVPTKPDWEVV